MSASITISPVEVLALKKLVLINHALQRSLKEPAAKQEQGALVRVLNDVALRADIANSVQRAEQ
jgi:hypothetical protein